MFSYKEIGIPSVVRRIGHDWPSFAIESGQIHSIDGVKGLSCTCHLGNNVYNSVSTIHRLLRLDARSQGRGRKEQAEIQQSELRNCSGGPDSRAFASGSVRAGQAGQMMNPGSLPVAEPIRHSCCKVAPIRSKSDCSRVTSVIGLTSMFS